jgi:hypothetical protein
MAAFSKHGRACAARHAPGRGEEKGVRAHRERPLLTGIPDAHVVALAKLWRGFSQASDRSGLQSDCRQDHGNCEQSGSSHAFVAAACSFRFAAYRFT